MAKRCRRYGARPAQLHRSSGSPGAGSRDASAQVFRGAGGTICLAPKGHPCAIRFLTLFTDGAQLPLFGRQGKSVGRACCASPPAKASTPKLPRVAWTKLLKRMAGYEMETCPDCGAQLVIVGVVLEPSKIQFALVSRGLLDPITNSPSRGPPSPQLDLFPISPGEPEPDTQVEMRGPPPASPPPPAP